MRKTFVKAVVSAMLLSLLASLLSGCFWKNAIVDGPGMVNYPGILLEALVGDWESEDDYSITFWDDNTFSLSYNHEPLIESAQLVLYANSTDTDEYNEFDINPNTFTDDSGNSVEVSKASHENGTVTLELAAADGTKTEIKFHRAHENEESPEMLDGSGMSYYGGILNDALAGAWQSEDGRFVLDFQGQCADFTVDGKQLVSKDYGYFVDHGFSESDDLNERCELYPTNFLDEFDEPPLTISEMWYQAEHIYMNVIWPDGKAQDVVFIKQAPAEGD